MTHRKHVLSLAALALLAACAGPSLAELAVGQSAPPFELVSVGGEKVSLADYAGKTVVLEWFNPNCPVSRRHAEAKTMTSTEAKHPAVVWLGINSTKTSHGDYLDPAAQKKYMDEHGVDYPVLYDTSGDVGRAYGAKTTPHMYVIDPAGKIAYMGAIDDDPRGKGASVNYVDAALSALAAGEPVDPASTKPYGCSVKY